MTTNAEIIYGLTKFDWQEKRKERIAGYERALREGTDLEGQPINEQDIAWLNKALESAKAERFPAFNPGAW